MFKSIRQYLFKKKPRLSLGQMILLEKELIGKKIYRLCHGKVFQGLYKNTKIIPKEHWSFDLGSKILGVYEKQVQEVINRIADAKSKFLIIFIYFKVSFIFSIMLKTAGQTSIFFSVKFNN